VFFLFFFENAHGLVIRGLSPIGVKLEASSTLPEPRVSDHFADAFPVEPKALTAGVIAISEKALDGVGNDQIVKHCSVSFQL
jgi:hypothetical protein